MKPCAASAIGAVRCRSDGFEALGLSRGLIDSVTMADDLGDSLDVCAVALVALTAPQSSRTPDPPLHGPSRAARGHSASADNFYVIVGAGANIAVQIGPDGVVVVDTGSGERVGRGRRRDSQAHAREPIRYIINTSADRDHVGGNDDAVGGGAVGDSDRRPERDRRRRRPRADPGRGERAVGDDRADRREVGVSGRRVADGDVFVGRSRRRRRTSTSTAKRSSSPISPRRTPTATASCSSAAPTCSSPATSSITTRFPVIDLEKGGSMQGVIDASTASSASPCRRFRSSGRRAAPSSCPAHGLISHEADVVDYRDMVTIVRDRIQDLIKKGMTLEQMRKADPVKGYRRRYGSDTGAVDDRSFIEAVYKSLGGK